LLGVVIAALILSVAHFSGVAAEVSWVPFIFLAIIGFGFATWEAGFIGMHAPNVHFARFEKALAKGRHVLFVETDQADEQSLKKVVKNHPELERAGIEVTHTWLLMVVLRNWEKFRNWALIFQGRPNRQQ